MQAINAAWDEGSYEGATIICAKRLGSKALERRDCLQNIQLSVQLGCFAKGVLVTKKFIERPK